MRNDQILEAKNGNGVFYFPGLMILVLWIGVGCVRIGTHMDGKSDTWVVSNDDFRSIINN